MAEVVGEFALVVVVHVADDTGFCWGILGCLVCGHCHSHCVVSGVATSRTASLVKEGWYDRWMCRLLGASEMTSVEVTF